jgi:exodeoxyribonuclease VII small subunit
MATKKQSYKEAFTELEEILIKIESDELNVDDLTAQVKRAAELIKFCKSKLFETESEIEKIIAEIDGIEE